MKIPDKTNKEVRRYEMSNLTTRFFVSLNQGRSCGIRDLFIAQNKNPRGSKMAQWVNVLAMKPDNLV